MRRENEREMNNRTRTVLITGAPCARAPSWYLLLIARSAIAEITGPRGEADGDLLNGRMEVLRFERTGRAGLFI